MLLGYIEEIKNLMLSKSVKNLQETVDLYSKDVPDTLTSQFTERKSRAVAVASKSQRRSNVTQLYPTGGCGTCFYCAMPMFIHFMKV